MAGSIQAGGKPVRGWGDLAGPGTDIKSPSVAEYWNPASGSQSGTITGTEAVAKGMQVVMAPANHTYLDQKYVAGSGGEGPPPPGPGRGRHSGCAGGPFFKWGPGRYPPRRAQRKLIR